MRAVTIPEFGAPDVLRLADVPVPEPGPGQVAVDVAYAGANFAEVLYRRGLVDVPLPIVPGIEVSEAHEWIESGSSTGKIVLAV